MPVFLNIIRQNRNGMTLTNCDNLAYCLQSSIIELSNDMPDYVGRSINLSSEDYRILGVGLPALTTFAAYVIFFNKSRGEAGELSSINKIYRITTPFLWGIQLAVSIPFSQFTTEERNFDITEWSIDFWRSKFCCNTTGCVNNLLSKFQSSKVFSYTLSEADSSVQAVSRSLGKITFIFTAVLAFKLFLSCFIAKRFTRADAYLAVMLLGMTIFAIIETVVAHSFTVKPLFESSWNNCLAQYTSNYSLVPSARFSRSVERQLPTSV